MDRHVCPWWLGYLLASPIRRLWQKPEEILRPHLREGMTALDIGSGMGFFTFPMAEMVGPKGKVIAIDLQSKMIKSLKKRAKRKELDDRIDARTCDENSLRIDDLKGQVDFALVMAVVHEVPESPQFFRQIHSALKPDGRLLFAEPTGHIDESEFTSSRATAVEQGFSIVQPLQVKRTHAALLQKA
ncbi:MAG: methyltransferase domain-containing protein [candidate division Zixibacteria bacterium]|nr:methyltransferase domain-containing protein [candidate division Zixibacteria bacterium]